VCVCVCVGEREKSAQPMSFGEIKRKDERQKLHDLFAGMNPRKRPRNMGRLRCGRISYFMKHLILFG